MRGSAAFRTGVAPGGALAGPWVKNELYRKARAVPSLDLRFADNKLLTDAITGANLVTFTRASSGTFVGSDGVLRSAVTNLLLRSEEFDNASWTLFGTASRTANTTVAPDGTTTADSVTLPTSSGIFQLVTGSASITYTFSVWIKCSTTQTVRLVINTNLADPTTLTVTATSSFQRFSITKTTSVGTLTVSSQIDTGGGNTFVVWGAQLEQASTVGEYIPTTSAINSAPRFDHNPTTGESLGLLVEEARTNSLTNNTMVGAVAGTPGTLPTGWPFQSGGGLGLSVSIVGTGTESGVAYLDWKVSGTASATTTATISFGRGSALTAQTWTTSSYLKLAAGSFSGVTSITLDLIEETVANTFVTGSQVSITLPTANSLITQRPTASRTLTGGATVALLRTNLSVLVSSGSTIDITLRIGLPQLEQGAFATSVIQTSTATVTRAADVASITGTNFSSFYNQTEGTLFAEATASPNIFTSYVAISNGTTSQNSTYFDNDTGIIRSVTFSASTAVSVLGLGSIGTVGTGNKLTSAYKTNDFAAARNGGTVQTDTSGTVPVSVTQLDIGRNPNAAATTHLSGTIKRVVYFPQRLPNSTLQAISQP